MSKQTYKVFPGQGYLKLKFDTKNTDIATGTVVTAEVKYLKPDGTQGTLTGCTIEGTLVIKQLSNSDIDQYGVWTFQPVVTVDGLIGPCDIAYIEFTPTIF